MRASASATSKTQAHLERLPTKVPQRLAASTPTAMSSLAALQAENARLKAENQRLQAALAARDTDADLLQTLGRSPPRGRTLAGQIGARSLSPGSELERRPPTDELELERRPAADALDGVDNDLAKLLEEGLPDGLDDPIPPELRKAAAEARSMLADAAAKTLDDAPLGEEEAEELPDWLKEGLDPKIPKHLKEAFGKAKKFKKKPLPRLSSSYGQGAAVMGKINPLAGATIAKKAAMRLADRARRKAEKAPWGRGTLQFHSLSAPQTLRALPSIVWGRPRTVGHEMDGTDSALVWPDLAELVNDICPKSGVLVSDPQGFPLSFLDELQKRFRRDATSTDQFDEFETTGRSNGHDMHLQCMCLPPNFETRLHGHVAIELCYVLSGTLTEHKLHCNVPCLGKDEEKVPALDLSGVSPAPKTSAETKPPRCGDVPETACWRETEVEVGEYLHNDVGSVHQITSGSDGASLLLLWCGVDEPYTRDRVHCALDELRVRRGAGAAYETSDTSPLRLREGTWSNRGEPYFSVDDQILAEMRAEGLLEEPPEPAVDPFAATAVDPFASGEGEKQGLLHSQHWRRPAEPEPEVSPVPVDERSWGSLHQAR